MVTAVLPASGIPAGTPPPARPRWWRRAVRRLVRAVVGLVVLGVASLAVAWQLTPDVGDARDRVDERLAAAGAPGLQGELPPELTAAVLATEDSRFHDHPGVDPLGVARAVRGLTTGVDLGGSTLEQQLAKNVYEDGENGPLERVSAVVVGLKLDRSWTKDEVLRMYLDDGYFGHGFTGATAAAEGYFGVAPQDLDWAQAALLAGLLQAPSAYDPVRHPDLAAARQEHVLDRLVDVGTLTREQANDATDDPWRLVAG